MLQSVNQLASLVGADRATVIRRADQLGLLPRDGEKGAKLYDSRSLLQLVPLPSRGTEGAATKEEAQIRQITADAKLKELQSAKLEGVLADVSELLAAQNEIFDQLAAIVKKSSLADAEKEDILSAMAQAVRFWESGE